MFNKRMKNNELNQQEVQTDVKPKMVKDRTGRWLVKGLIFTSLLGSGVAIAGSEVSADDGNWYARTADEIKNRINASENSNEFTFEKGDTFYEIAKALNVKYTKLMEINGFAEGSQYTVPVGTKITFDGAHVTTTDKDGNVTNEEVLTNNDKIDKDKPFANQASDDIQKDHSTKGESSQLSKAGSKSEYSANNSKPTINSSSTTTTGAKPGTTTNTNKPSNTKPSNTKPGTTIPGTVIKPSESKPNIPLTPIKPGTPGETNPSVPWTPIEPGIPGETEPSVPWTPIEPGIPGETEPSVPWTPIEPGTPGETEPSVPWTPIEPGTPGETEPSVPWTPIEPGTPSETNPTQPWTPIEPSTPAGTDLESLKELLVFFNEQKSEAEVRVTDLQTQITGVGVHNAVTEIEINSIQLEISNLQNKISILENEKSIKQVELEAAQQEAAAWQAEHPTESLPAELQSKLDAIQSDINELDGQIANHQSQIDANQAKIAELQSTMKDEGQLQVELDQANADVAYAQSKIDETQAKIDELEGQASAEQALNDAKNEALKRIETLNLKGEKQSFIGQINGATSIEEVNSIMENATNTSITNDEADQASADAKYLQDAKDAANEHIEGLNLRDEKQSYIDRVNTATSVSEVNSIMFEADMKASENDKEDAGSSAEKELNDAKQVALNELTTLNLKDEAKGYAANIKNADSLEEIERTMTAARAKSKDNDAEDENSSNAEKELIKAKNDAKAELQDLNLKGEESKFEARIDKATSIEEVKAILENAKANSVINDEKDKAEQVEKEKELIKAKNDAKAELQDLNLKGEESKFEARIDKATSIEEVKAILENAKADSVLNDEKDKVEADQAKKLQQAKDNAKVELNSLNLKDEKGSYEARIENAKTIDEINSIMAEARNKSEENNKPLTLDEYKKQANDEIDQLEGLNDEIKARYKSNINRSKTKEDVDVYLNDAKSKSAFELNKNRPQTNPSDGSKPTISNSTEQQDVAIKILVDLINADRVAQGLNPLTYDDKLAGMAQVRAEDMGRQSENGRPTISHTRPDGNDKIDAYGEANGIYTYPYSSIAEMVAYNNMGNKTGEEAGQMMYNQIKGSQDHYDIAMSTRANSVGVGMYTDPKTGITYYAVEIGNKN